MKVCYFGTYDKFNWKNEILIAGLKRNGVDVVECHVSLWEDTDSKIQAVKTKLGLLGLGGRVASRYLQLIFKHRKIGKYDVMILGYTGQYDVFLGKVLTLLSGKPLVLDAYQSIHDTIVFDRTLANESSIVARLAYLLDKYSCVLADLVLLDTQTHINHFCAKFGLSPDKFHRVFVGADDRYFKPMVSQRNDSYFKVVYFGGYVPLHGTKYIMQCAAELAKEPDIRFVMIGNGQMYQETRDLAEHLGLSNVSFIETGMPGRWLPPEDLARLVANSDVCLGVFGLGQKCDWVIPSKVCVGLAMKKAVLTGDTPAVREVFSDRENVILCERGNGEAIADAILLLKRNESLRNKIARNGYQLFRNKFSLKAIGREMNDALVQLLTNKQ